MAAPKYDNADFDPAAAGADAPLQSTSLVSDNRRVQARARRRAAARRRRTRLVGVLAAVAVTLAGLAWARGPGSDIVSVPLVTRSGASGTRAVFRATDPVENPTPIFATYKSLQLRLPVAVSDLTEVGFHQASYDWALPLKTPLPDADAEKSKKRKGTNRDISKQGTGADAVLTGKVLRMWRDRPGKPNTAIDIGADPGTQLVSPIDGTVVLVKKYDLYNNPDYRDYQIHIQPDGMPELDLVMIHIKDPTVKAGDRVMAGISPIGKVRKFSDRMNLQLEHYTSSTGDHTHVQINDTTDPEYHGLDDVADADGP